jgi:pentapeptide MXKDX repeat protein
MSSLFRVLALVCFVSLGSLAVTGCGSKATAPDKMAADKMGGDKMADDKMGEEKMK